MNINEPPCAVEGCVTAGRRQVCPFDNRCHGHGRIHYDSGHPESKLTFRKDAWHLICDEHYEVVKAEREHWLAERSA